MRVIRKSLYICNAKFLNREVTMVAQCVALGIFYVYMQIAIYGVQPRAVAVMSASLSIKDLATGSERRYFFRSRAKKFIES